MNRRQTTVGRPRRSPGRFSGWPLVGILAMLVLVAGIAIWGRGPAAGPYKDLVLNDRATMIFLYADPTPSMPGG